MKFKVILYNNTSTQDVDKAAQFSFYTLTGAQSCAASWIETVEHRAYLYDGNTWYRVT